MIKNDLQTNGVRGKLTEIGQDRDSVYQTRCDPKNKFVCVLMKIRLKSKKNNTTETFYSRSVGTDLTNRNGQRFGEVESKQ